MPFVLAIVGTANQDDTFRLRANDVLGDAANGSSPLGLPFQGSGKGYARALLSLRPVDWDGTELAGGLLAIGVDETRLSRSKINFESLDSNGSSEHYTAFQARCARPE